MYENQLSIRMAANDSFSVAVSSGVNTIFINTSALVGINPTDDE